MNSKLRCNDIFQMAYPSLLAQASRVQKDSQGWANWQAISKLFCLRDYLATFEQNGTKYYQKLSLRDLNLH